MTGRIYILGQPGVGKSYLCNLYAKRDHEIFIYSDDPNPVTSSVTIAPSRIEGWDICDSPGLWDYDDAKFRVWWKEQRNSITNYIIFIVTIPQGGRTREDATKIGKELCKLGVKKYYLICNRTKTNLHACNKGYINFFREKSILPPTDVLALSEYPTEREIAAFHKQIDNVFTNRVVTTGMWLFNNKSVYYFYRSGLRSRLLGMLVCTLLAYLLTTKYLKIH